MSKERVPLIELVQKVVHSSQWGKENLSIWGGYCDERDLLQFLQEWGLNSMPYRIWKYTSEIVFNQNKLPANIVLLQRGRLFGEGGDLEFRREGAGFRWRFIGPAGVQPPTGDYGKHDYWVTHRGVTFHCHEEMVLLWGQWNAEKGRWVEDRIGAAPLNYPVPSEWQRVQVHYKAFSRAGRMEFVWYTGLSEWKEADNG